jgi:hypothetical protein
MYTYIYIYIYIYIYVYTHDLNLSLHRDSTTIADMNVCFSIRPRELPTETKELVPGRRCCDPTIHGDQRGALVEQPLTSKACHTQCLISGALAALQCKEAQSLAYDPATDGPSHFGPFD